MAAHTGQLGGAAQDHHPCLRARTGGFAPLETAADGLFARVTLRRQTAVVPKLAPLQRTITEHVQGGRVVMERKIQNSSLGKDIAARTKPKAEKELEPWEKELLAKLDMSDKPATSK